MRDEYRAMLILEELFDSNTYFYTRKLADIYAKRAFVGYFSAMGLSLNEMGNYIKRDHATVHWHKIKFNDEYQYNRYFKKKYEQFTTLMLKPKDGEIHHF